VLGEGQGFGIPPNGRRQSWPLQGAFRHAHRSSTTQPDDTSRNKFEHVLDDARRLIEANQRSLAEVSELVRQCRDIIQRAEHALPPEHLARAGTQAKSTHSQKNGEDCPPLDHSRHLAPATAFCNLYPRLVGNHALWSPLPLPPADDRGGQFNRGFTQHK